MIRKEIILAGLMLCGVLFFAGCGQKVQKPTNNAELDAYKHEAAVKELKHSQEMQLAVIQAQDESAALRVRIDELTKQLDKLQAELAAYKQKPEKVENAGDLEQKYKKLQAENEELRKLVQYERGLRDDLLKRIERDQITIKELQSKLNE